MLEPLRLLDLDSSSEDYDYSKVFELIDKLFLARADVSEYMESYSGLSILIAMFYLLKTHFINCIKTNIFENKI